ncbi:hypothetical protein FN846DRAFT_890926 [Sphaerosporella brunnea]|uniref:Uncharacterized protein n=1 Tax=Sphaerosporella brunnea TaxID=1250544 RepID=A0A5J5EU66_9PEZI|nr:hypothetical protein FN846DRAFT_890926 [Sphaerosporella brunnea]
MVCTETGPDRGWRARRAAYDARSAAGDAHPTWWGFESEGLTRSTAATARRKSDVAGRWSNLDKVGTSAWTRAASGMYEKRGIPEDICARHRDTKKQPTTDAHIDSAGAVTNKEDTHQTKIPRCELRAICGDTADATYPAGWLHHRALVGPKRGLQRDGFDVGYGNRIVDVPPGQSLAGYVSDVIVRIPARSCTCAVSRTKCVIFCAHSRIPSSESRGDRYGGAHGSIAGCKHRAKYSKCAVEASGCSAFASGQGKLLESDRSKHLSTSGYTALVQQNHRRKDRNANDAGLDSGPADRRNSQRNQRSLRNVPRGAFKHMQTPRKQLWPHNAETASFTRGINALAHWARSPIVLGCACGYHPALGGPRVVSVHQQAV